MHMILHYKNLLNINYKKILNINFTHFFEKRLQHRCFLWILRNFWVHFFYRTPAVAAFKSGTTAQQSQLSVLWFRTSTCFQFWSKTSQSVAQIIIYYHVTKQFLHCFNWLITCLGFQNMFRKSISWFWLWWKTYTKRCTNSNVISCVRGHSSLALCSWSSSFNFRIWFGKRKNSM